MKEVYSNAKDCLELAKDLKKKMGNKIDFYGSINQAIIRGKYFSHYREPHSEIDYLFEDGLPFYYKFCKEDFLRIQIGSFHPHNNSRGEKLAALSDFYQVLREPYGEPTVFYTTKEDEEGTLSLQWSFRNKEEEIQRFKDGTYFDDAEIDELIVIGEPKVQTALDKVRNSNVRHIGLPFELIGLVEENIKDYAKYKNGKEFSCPLDDEIENIQVTLYERKLALDNKSDKKRN